MLVSRENISRDEMIAAGKDTTKVQSVSRLDKIVEIEPVGFDDATVVREWWFFDHFVQDFDPSKNNYGVITEHLESIDINYDNYDAVIWAHVNAIDYNAELDMVIITAKNLIELYVIDHTTTMKEVAGHTGGNYNIRR